MKKDFGISHLFKSTLNSFSGLKIAFYGEQAFRHECFVLLILSAILFFTDKKPQEWIIVIGLWLFVMSIELLNSAIEKTCDLVTKDFNILIKSAKDMASAAIFIVIIINILAWISVFFM